MMVSKGITLLAQMSAFNYDIREWCQQSTELKMYAHFNIHTAVVQNIYGVPPPPI